MLNTAYPTQRYLIGPKLLPKGGRMLLTAENGTGKSALALNIVASIITGKGLFGFTHTHKDKDYGKDLFPTAAHQTCLYIDYEIPAANRKEERLLPLTKVFGTKFADSVFFPKRPSDYRLENGRNEGHAGSFDRFYSLVSRTKPSVIVIDPFSSTHSVDENSNAVKQPLNAIDRLIDASGATVILVHHESTKELRDNRGNVIEKNTKEKARGHSALTDWADLHLSLTEIKCSRWIKKGSLTWTHSQSSASSSRLASCSTGTSSDEHLQSRLHGRLHMPRTNRIPNTGRYPASLYEDLQQRSDKSQRLRSESETEVDQAVQERIDNRKLIRVSSSNG
jgi:hypothetical protein